MMRPISISLSPNVESDDLAAAWRMVLSPHRWLDGSLIEQARSRLKELAELPHVVLASSGRSALWLLLEALNIGDGDEVIVQAFTCIAVPEPILWRGATPVYADIAENSYNVDPRDVRRKITAHTKAIIVQHTFGIPADIDELLTIAREHKLLLIEDCAHSLGARHNGKAVGTFGDAAIYSFGRDKLFSSVFGGAVGTRDEVLAKRMQDIQRGRELPPRRWILQQLVHPILLDILLPWYFAAQFGKVWLVFLQKLGILSRAVTAAERQGEMPAFIRYRYVPALAFLLGRQLAKGERFSRLRHATAQKYQAALQNASFELPQVKPADQPSWLRYPVRHVETGRLLQDAKKQHILLGDWYRAPLFPADFNAARFRYTTGSCPRAEAAAANTINLPTHPRLNEDDINRVINFLRNV